MPVAMASDQLPTGALRVRVGPTGRPFYEAKWRAQGRQRLRRIGPAWLEADGADSWRRRRGRVRAGYFDEKQAIVRMAEMIASEAGDQERRARAAEQAKRRVVTFRDVAADWLDWQERVKGARPSTLRDLRSILAEPDSLHRRGQGRCAGRILRAFGDRLAEEIDTRDVGVFLRELDDAGLTPRNVNKHRQVLSAIFGYATRADTFALAANPVIGTDKRRELPAAALDFYEPDEIEALARVAAGGRHRTNGVDVGDEELALRCAEDAQDAELFRVLAYTGLRLGEAVALRWGDVDLAERRLIVQRARSGGQEGPTKAWQVRYVPLADPAAQAFERLRARYDFTSRDDYVCCGRLGGPLDDSALRRRYKAAVKAAGLRYIKLHGLRHGAGSLVARQTDAVFVQHFLGHAKLSTTERYMHAKARREDIGRLNVAFAPSASASTTPAA